MDVLNLDKLEKFKNGALGVTRNGLKAKFTCQEDETSIAVVVVFKDNNFRFEHYSSLPYYRSNGDDDLDIISLWGDKPEPFDLDRALAGEPFIFGGKQSFILCPSRMTFGYVCQNVDGDLFVLDRTHFVSCSMWKEPEPVKPSVDDLPKPIKEFGDLKEVWFIAKDGFKYVPYVTLKGENWSKIQIESLHNGCYYASAEDCQAVCYWLMNR